MLLLLMKISEARVNEIIISYLVVFFYQFHVFINYIVNLHGIEISFELL